ncbi:MAG: hypothetical protein K0S27_404 [Gammaproteobacteria bacterium]|jgi:hypothetical protein|nr:hypothetical protein [Gammaproteobacteria bacterium]
MKNEYQGNKGYQAAGNKADNYRNPNAPTQGGFSTPGGGAQQKDKNKAPQLKNPQSNRPNPHQPNNAWGTGSINKTDKDSRK